MRLLAGQLPQLHRLLPPGHVFISTTFLVGLVGLEYVGRLAGNDLHDALAGLTLLSLIGLLVSFHRRTPLHWVSWVVTRVRSVRGIFEPLKYDHGIDLRGAPPIPRRLPPAVWGVLALLAVWAGVSATVWSLQPDGWRVLGLRSSYVLYLLVLFAVWTGLLVCTFIGLYVPVLLIDRRLRGVMRENDRRGLELLIVALYVMAMTAVAWVIPTAVVLTICLLAACVASYMVIQGGSDEPAILWRARPTRPIYAVPLRRVVAGMLGVAVLVVFNLLLTACGGHLFSQPTSNDPMPITATLGTMAAWMVPGVVLVACLRLIDGRRTDPSQRTPPVVCLQTTLGPDATQKAMAAVQAWGWDVRLAKAGARPRTGEVGVLLVPPEQSEATEFDPAWPLKVSVDDLTAGAVKDRLARRDEIQLRRHAMKGLATLMKRAAAERTVKGGGYWFAPHWWFMTGLDRDEPRRGRANRPAPPKQVGPPFHKLFGPRVRQHFHEVLRAVQVDMIFVEDGVSSRTFARVVRMLFELYDRTGGRRQADDHIFTGLPKVKVVVHDYAPEKPSRPHGFRETHFDELSRARVLHVFRDSGGEEAPTETPFDFSWEPSPALGVG